MPQGPLVADDVVHVDEEDVIVVVEHVQLEAGQRQLVELERARGGALHRLAHPLMPLAGRDGAPIVDGQVEARRRDDPLHGCAVLDHEDGPQDFVVRDHVVDAPRPARRRRAGPRDRRAPAML